LIVDDLRWFARFLCTWAVLFAITAVLLKVFGL
jgi:hypothetical protein